MRYQAAPHPGVFCFDFTYFFTFWACRLLGVWSVEELEALGPVGCRRLFGDDFFGFCCHVWPGFVDEPFYRFLCGVLEGFGVDDFLRLLLWCPPRHGKSLVVRLWVLWRLFLDPSLRVGFASYSEALALVFVKDLRRLVRNCVWLGLGVVRGDGARSDWGVSFGGVSSGGNVMAVGVGGGFTGRGVDVLVVDDPVKSLADALSLASRERVWGWFRTVAETRLEAGGSALVVQTRWHPDDLSGRLEAQGGWRVLSLPALGLSDDLLGRRPGEALAPSRFSEADLLLKRESLGERLFGCLYQQVPLLEAGGFFVGEPGLFSWQGAGCSGSLVFDGGGCSLDDLDVFLVVDSAGTLGSSADWSVIGLFGFDGSRLFVLSWVRGRFSQRDLVARIGELFGLWPCCSGVWVEEAPVSLGLIEALEEKQFAVHRLKVSGRSKVSRASHARVWFERGRVLLGDPDRTVWVPPLLQELREFPAGRFDDQVDVLVYGVEVARGLAVGQGEVARPRSRGSRSFVDGGVWG